MSKSVGSLSEEFDDLDFLHGLEDEVHLLEDVSHDAVPARTARENAWQRVERYSEAKLLRDELSDWSEWDYWDEYFDTH